MFVKPKFTVIKKIINTTVECFRHDNIYVSVVFPKVLVLLIARSSRGSWISPLRLLLKSWNLSACTIPRIKLSKHREHQMHYVFPRQERVTRSCALRHIERKT